MDDTRTSQRAPADFDVRTKSASHGEFTNQVAHDISTGGLFLRTDSPLPPGTLLRMDFPLGSEAAAEGANGSRAHGVGRVVWIRTPDNSSAEKPAGMGIKFVRVDEPSREMVEAFVEQHGSTLASREGDVHEATDAQVAFQPVADDANVSEQAAAEPAQQTGLPEQESPDAKPEPPNGDRGAQQPQEGSDPQRSASAREQLDSVEVDASGPAAEDGARSSRVTYVGDRNRTPTAGPPTDSGRTMAVLMLVLVALLGIVLALIV